MSVEVIATVLGVVLSMILSIVGFFIVRTLNRVEGSMESMTNSVNSLNNQMGKLVTEMSFARRDIDRHGNEIDKIKDHIFGKK